MDTVPQRDPNSAGPSEALLLLASQRPRNVSWLGAAGLLFGDWGTSRLYVLGLAFLVAGRSSFYLIAAMSLLILAVGWAYTHICRIYPDGGGVYTAGKYRHRLLGVIGALLLFADYTVTASLSAVEAFHYFGLGAQSHAQIIEADPGDEIRMPRRAEAAAREPLWALNSPGLWAIVSILAIGAFNLMGPKHTAGYAIFAAGGMVLITLLIAVGGLLRLDFSQIDWGKRLVHQNPWDVWQGFVFIVLALSGVEAIANLTGVMKRPVFGTARKSIWTVAGEVAVFNVLLAIIMIALAPPREAHTEDMLAYMAGQTLGSVGEWLVRIIGGLLLLSATNTAINGLTSITYVMSRDGEMPAVLQKLNGFGSPWIAVLLAAGVPALVLLFAHDLRTLASLYAIGVVGAVAIAASLCAFHPRLRKRWRRVAMSLLGVLLILIWITLALTKMHALLFVSLVLLTGLILRKVTQYAAAKRAKPSLLRQAIMAQLSPEALSKPRLLLATAGSTHLASAAIQRAKAEGAALVVTFVRELSLGYMFQNGKRLSIDTDPAAQELFVDFLEIGHREGIPIIPAYDTGISAAEMVAELAAVNGASRVMIGSSRRGPLHQLIKGSFQRKLESLLPPEIPVEVLSVTQEGGQAN